MRKGLAITDDELTHTLSVLAAYRGNQTQTAQQLGMTQGGVRKRILAAKQRGLLTDDQEAAWKSRESFISGRRLPQTADDAWAVLDDFIGRSRRVTSSAVARKRQHNHTQRIVIASDFHAPFHSNEAVAELIARESAHTDTLIVGGDFTDSYSYSSFIRSERVAPEFEWAACDALMGQLSSAFRDIVMIKGNHDARLEKRLRANLSPEIMFAVEQLTGGILDPCQALAERYPNVRFQSHQVGRHGIGWFAQFGDLLVSHAERYSKVPSSVVRWVEEWLTDQHLALELKPWRVLMQAHTHAMGWTPWKADRLLVEIGCLCDIHSYQLQARISGRTQRRGYAVCEQTDGITDVNSVRLVWLDADRTGRAA